MEDKPFNFFYALFITVFFLCTLDEIASAKKESASQQIKPGCYNAPIYIYDERINKYYRQDWCKHSKQPVYFDFIPVPSNGDKSKKQTDIERFVQDYPLTDVSLNSDTVMKRYREFIKDTTSEKIKKLSAKAEKI